MHLTPYPLLFFITECLILGFELSILTPLDPFDSVNPIIDELLLFNEMTLPVLFPSIMV